MAVQVLQSLSQSLDVRLLDLFQGHTAVHLQTLCSGYDDHQTGLQTCLTALDVEELLCSQVGTKACLSHHIVAEGHGQLRSQYTGAAVGNVGKRSTMNIGRCMLSGLHQVWLQGIAQQHSDGSCHSQVFHLEVFPVGRDAQYNILYTTLQVLLTGSQTEYSHQLRGWGDVKACLSHYPIATQTSHHISQGTVIHVEHPLPEYLPQRKTLLTVVVEVVVEQCTDGVVCRGHSMEVSREVEVDFLHRQHLSISSSCCTTLHAEAGPQ